MKKGHYTGLSITQLLSVILDFIFPRNELVMFLEKVTAIEAFASFPRCTKQTSNLFMIFQYRNRVVKSMIRELKYKGNKSVARLCGEIVYKFILENSTGSMMRDVFPLPTILIPIPLASERRRERGFNQNELVIKEIILCDVDKKLSFSFDVLEKNRHTKPQSSIKNRKERLKNLNGCFSVVHPDLVCGKNIILIDDVTTTGSTLSEARAVLLKAGANTVNAIAIAH